MREILFQSQKYNLNLVFKGALMGKRGIFHLRSQITPIPHSIRSKKIQLFISVVIEGQNYPDYWVPLEFRVGSLWIPSQKVGSLY